MKNTEEQQQEALEAFIDFYGDDQPYLPLEERRFVSESDVHPSQRED